MTLKIAIPNKGRLMEDTIDLLRSIGLRVPHNIDRMLIAKVNGGRYQILFTRAGDIPEYVEMGAADVGITGLDLVEEVGEPVEKVLELDYGRCKLVLAAPEQSGIGSADDLPKNARIATAHPNLAKRFFEKRKQKVRIIPISGAAEITPYIGVADAIIDLTQTGATLKQNHLSMLEVAFDSVAVLIASKKALKGRAQEIEDLAEGIRGVQAAHRKRYLMANVSKSKLDAVSKVIPGLSGPTVMELAKKGMVAVHAVVDEDDLNQIIPKLKKSGATGILVLPIERLIP